MCEKIDGKWFFSTGTGWKTPFDENEAKTIVSAREISHLPKIQKNAVYKNSYPLSKFFKNKGGKE